MPLHEKHVWIAEAFFTPSEVDSILAVANKKDWDEGRVGFDGGKDPDAQETDGGAVNSQIRQSQVKWLMVDEMNEEFHKKLYSAVQYACGDNHWNWEFTNWENYQFTNYTAKPNLPKGDFYTWHTDAGPPTRSSYEDGSIRKLSCTIQLSDPDDYEGGLFQWLEPVGTFDKIQLGQRTVGLDDMTKTAPFSAKTRGSIILFPSDVHHQVTPVTRGSRNSLVGWLLGLPYK